MTEPQGQPQQPQQTGQGTGPTQPQTPPGQPQEGTGQGQQGQQGHGNRRLEDLLADVDEDTRNAVLGEVRQARRDAATYRQRYQEAEPLARQAREAQQAQMTEAQRAQEAQASAERERDEANAKLLRYSVAAEKGLDASDADFLTGTSREEIEAAAERLATRLRVATEPRQPAPDRSQASGANGGRAVSDDEAFGQLIQQKLRS